MVSCRDLNYSNLGTRRRDVYEYHLGGFCNCRLQNRSFLFFTLSTAYIYSIIVIWYLIQHMSHTTYISKYDVVFKILNCQNYSWINIHTSKILVHWIFTHRSWKSTIRKKIYLFYILNHQTIQHENKYTTHQIKQTKNSTNRNTTHQNKNPNTNRNTKESSRLETYELTKETK